MIFSYTRWPSGGLHLGIMIYYQAPEHARLSTTAAVQHTQRSRTSRGHVTASDVTTSPTEGRGCRRRSGWWRERPDCMLAASSQHHSRHSHTHTHTHTRTQRPINTNRYTRHEWPMNETMRPIIFHARWPVWRNGRAFASVSSLDHVTATHVPLLSSSVIWYRPMSRDALRLGR